jgi:hypothetical protein
VASVAGEVFMRVGYGRGGLSGLAIWFGLNGRRDGCVGLFCRLSRLALGSACIMAVARCRASLGWKVCISLVAMVWGVNVVWSSRLVSRYWNKGYQSSCWLVANNFRADDGRAMRSARSWYGIVSQLRVVK